MSIKKIVNPERWNFEQILHNIAGAASGRRCIKESTKANLQTNPYQVTGSGKKLKTINIIIEYGGRYGDIVQYSGIDPMAGDAEKSAVVSCLVP
jgi:hypothetical protein